MAVRQRWMRVWLVLGLLLGLAAPLATAPAALAVTRDPGTLVWSAATTLQASASQPYGASLQRFSALDDGRPLTVLVPTRNVTAIVVVLHGYHLSAADAEQQVNLAAAAARSGWVVAYPSGTDGSWDAGICCGASSNQEINDVGYVAGVVHDAELHFGLGVRLPTIGIGFSNGAMELADVACHRPTAFDALELVAGDLQDPGCVAARSKQVIEVLSASDVVVPALGGQSRVTGTDDLPDTFGFGVFTAGLRCRISLAATRTMAEQRAVCPNGEVVDRIRLRTGQHTWSTRSSAKTLDETAIARTLISDIIRRVHVAGVLPVSATCRLSRPGVDALATALADTLHSHCR